MLLSYIGQSASAVYTINGVPAKCVTYRVSSQTKSDCFSRSKRSYVKNHVFSFGNMDVDDEYESEPLASSFSAFKGDFEQTIVLLGMDVDEVEIEVQESLEEVILKDNNF